MKKVLSILAAFFLLVAVHAQKTGAKKTPVKIKYRGSAYWGSYKDSATVSEEDATKLLGQKLEVKDTKTTYTLVSYTFLYRRVNYADDFEKGEKTVNTTVTSKRFTVSPLPDLWQQSIAEQLHSGEEFEIFDVVAKDEKGKLFFAPNLKIKIK